MKNIFFIQLLLGFLILGCYSEIDTNIVIKNKMQNWKENNKNYKIEEDTSIELNKLNIVKINGLDKFINLEYLDLSGNKIFKIEKLNKLTKLKELYLEGNPIKKIEGLENCVNLEVLSFWGCPVKKIEGLTTLSCLKVLRLDKTKITKLEGLENCVNLTTLSLSETGITKIEGLEKLKHLRSINLLKTSLESLSGLENQSELEYLDISIQYHGYDLYGSGYDELKEDRQLVGKITNIGTALDNCKNLKGFVYYGQPITKEDLRKLKARGVNIEPNI
jgi:hypothetical protein